MAALRAASIYPIGYAFKLHIEVELQGRQISVVAEFPWPITDEELVLSNALAGVMNGYGARGDAEQSYLREAAAKLIVEAYNQGVRDPDILAHYALKALHGSGGGAHSNES